MRAGFPTGSNRIKTKMIKKILKNAAKKPRIAKIVVIALARVHQWSYRMLGEFAAAAEDGTHPKHRILKYKEWFLNNIEPGWVVLDVGCNTGLMPEVVSQKARFVYGIELNENRVREAKLKRQQPNIEYICGDAVSFDFADRFVDCVTLSNVLEHIEHRVVFLKKLGGNLKWNNKDDKRYLIRVPMINRDWITLYKKELGIEYRLDDGHFTEYTLEGLRDELHHAGIEITNHEIRFGEIYAICQGK